MYFDTPAYAIGGNATVQVGFQIYSSGNANFTIIAIEDIRNPLSPSTNMVIGDIEYSQLDIYPFPLNVDKVSNDGMDIGIRKHLTENKYHKLIFSMDIRVS